MNRKMKQEKLAKQISLALMAGMVTYTPVAFGMPTGGVSDTANIPTTYTDSTRTRGGETVNVKEMAITSDSTNNVINWTDFSVGTNEAVKFDGKNYANIVNGSATSMIDGFLEGGGNIYLINPNGVIFGKTAQVNVGNLYVSTQGKVDTSKFNDQEANPVLSVNGTPACDVVNLGSISATTVEVHGNNIRFLNAANINTPSASDVIQTIGTPACDVVNLGTIKADTVEVVGNNIRFLNAAQIQVKDPESTTPLTGSNVKVTASGYIHVGHEGSAPASGYNANKTITEYQLVHNLTELKAMNGSNN